MNRLRAYFANFTNRTNRTPEQKLQRGLNVLALELGAGAVVVKFAAHGSPLAPVLALCSLLVCALALSVPDRPSE